ncbi:helix-turn-helix domain-containing protein [Aestuariibius sp. 2305UL40-4]|uniref:helix-turn-helix domain-containing protein n=1 Tax=Aestuariibius violaceus TaxID=3234132 RepID=UPI00345ED46A
MKQSEFNLQDSANTTADQRLRLITFRRGEVWPEREQCEIVLVLDCQAKEFSLTDLRGRLSVGELVLLPVGDGTSACVRGRVLSARMDNLPAPPIPQRVGDRLIGQLLRRAWGSSYTASEIIDPMLSVIELLVASRVRAQQERLDLLDRLDHRIARSVDYIETHYGDALTIAELAGVACLSPGHFSRTFKTAMGVPVWAYVTRRRCERAKEMLLTTSVSIAEIAYRCGFANQGHLTRCFKEAFGGTPAAARNGFHCT